MSQPTRASDLAQRSAAGSWVSFFLGVPLGAGIVYAFTHGPLQDHPSSQFFHHPVEHAEVILFCCALTTIVGKWLRTLREGQVFRRSILPPWDGKAAPIAEAKSLRQHMGQTLPTWVLSSTLGRRLLSILDFVESRGSANDLDDQMRSLADGDALALDNSYSLLRFINWAIPILGFLGTVLGITGAISGIDPDKLDKEMHLVTGGLATAFDTTALALFLTMILMFFTFLIERAETRLLEQVDSYADAELAHRFERLSGDGGLVVNTLRQTSAELLDLNKQLIEHQAALWSASLEKSQKQWNGMAAEQLTQLTGALERAMEYALTRYHQRLVEMEGQLQQRHEAVLEGLAQVCHSLRDAGQEQAMTLARLTDTMGMQIESLTKLQSSEEHLSGLQQALARNLELLTSTGTFDQALQSLTAAIHLLTARAAAPARPLPRSDAA